MDDLWPEYLTVTEMKAPIAILREQASLLGKKTQNIVQAQTDRVDADSDVFYYVFHIVAPGLGNYRYRLFAIRHNIDFYPVVFDIGQDMKDEIYPDREKISAGSEKEFLDILKKIFQSERTKQIIQALISQSVAA